MKKNLKIYAGALLLTSALVAGGIALNSSLPKQNPNLDSSMVNSQVQDSVVDSDIVVMPEKILLDDGRDGYVLPSGYSLYYINENIPRVGMIGIEESTEDYTIYAGPSLSVLPNGEVVEVNLDGYIGIKDEYVQDLQTLASLKGEIASRNTDITKDLVKLENHDTIINPYFLDAGYELYDVADKYNNIAFPCVYEDNGTIYGLSPEMAQDFVGIPTDLYQYIENLEALKNYAEEVYYNENAKTVSRG